MYNYVECQTFFNPDAIDIEWKLLPKLSESGLGHCTRYNLKLQEANIVPQIGVYFNYESRLSRYSNNSLCHQVLPLINYTHSESFSHKSSHLTFRINH